MSPRFGLGCAMATPVRSDGGVDAQRLISHAKSLLTEGCDTVTVFGTTGEGASFGLNDRKAILAEFAKASFDMRRLVMGVMATTVEDAVAQSRAGLDAGCRALLMTPPYYFKDLNEDGLFAWFAEVFGALGEKARDVILYHIPSVTAVGISPDMVGRLRRQFPKAVAGVKDSSGNWENTQKLLAAHRDLMILVGDERYLARAMALGGQGCISGLANIAPDLMLPLVREAREEPRVNRLVEEITKFPVLPAVKALVAHRRGDKAWLAMRPPLVALDVAVAERVAAMHDSVRSAKAA